VERRAQSEDVRTGRTQDVSDADMHRADQRTGEHRRE
jgi:hypothetical protein